jgi:hypothetical protein
LGEVLDPVAVHTGLARLRTRECLADSVRGVRDAHAQVATLELSWYMRNQLLRDADWAGMAHSVEVRVPFVDIALFRAMARWLVSGTPPRKSDAAAAPLAPLPAGVLNRPKSGFSVPVRDWLAKQPGRRAEGRGLRGWALRVLPVPRRQFRALVLVSEAFGGYGGIAKFNRDFLSALAAMPECAEVIAVPRLAPAPFESLPSGVEFVTAAAGSKVRFTLQALQQAARGPVDIVIAGHVNLAPFAALIGWAKGAYTAMVIHGIDAWQPHRTQLVRSSVRQMYRVLGVSNLTL